MEKELDFCFYGGFTAMAKRDGMEATAAWASGKGFRSVEFYEEATEAWQPTAQDFAHARKLKAHLSDRGLKTACYSLFACLYGESADESERLLLKHAEYAAELGSPFLHHTLIGWLDLPPNAPSYEDALDEVTERAARIARRCKQLGLLCLYEEQGLYFNGVNGLGRFLKELKTQCDNVGVCGDMGNILFADEAPDEFFKAFQHEIRHVHLKDYFRAKAPTPDKAWYKTAGGNYLADAKLGEGIVPFEKCLAALKEAGYQGAYSFELASIDHFDEGLAFAKKLFI